VGAYLLVALLGQGGQGFVYRAERAGRHYAVKFLPVGMWEYGARERDILRRLSGVEGVVGLEDWGWWPEPGRGWLYLVLELVEGWRLDKYALVRNPSARVAGHLLLHLGRTLVEVEKRGARHRDVKRENIMVRAADGRPVLVDFGVGYLEGEPTLPDGWRPRATPEYVAPEAWRHLEEKGQWGEYTPGVADELWALGVTFYWLLMGHLPFGSFVNLKDMRKSVLERTPRVPHARNPRIPPVLGEVCMRLLEKEPAARYPSLEALCAALEAALASMGGEACWDEPMEDPDAPENQTTQALAELAHDSFARWQQQLNAARPRRGRVREWQEVEPAEAPAPVPPPPVALPAPQAVPECPLPRPEARKSPPDAMWSRWRGEVAGACVVLAAVVGALVFSAARQLSAEPPGEVAGRVASPLARWLPDNPTPRACLVQEVAGGWPPSEAGEGAAFALASTPAPAPAMLSRQQASHAKRPEKPSSPPLQKARSCVPLLTQVCKAGLCTLWLTGCTGAPVRPPPPPPADCPPGAEDVMDALDMDPRCPVYLTNPEREEDEEVTVPLGRITFKVSYPGRGGGCGNLPPGTRLSGAFFLGTVEGKTWAIARLTQAQTPEGKTYPVCMYIGDRGMDPGEDVLRPGDKPGTVVIAEWTTAFRTKRFE
jgi:serine/threonine-protein kinase